MARGPSSGATGVLRNTVVLAAARIIDRVSTLVIALLIAAKLGADGLGAYSVAMAVYGLIALAGDAGATMFLIREISKEPARTAAYVVHLSVVAVAVSVTLA